MAGAAWAKVETWRQEGAAAFAKYHRERVVISDQGRVRLGQALVPTGPLAAERVWDMVRARDGTVYAATGDAGKVFRQATKEGAAWTVALDATDSQALSLAATPQGKVFVGTGPGGQVIEVTDPEHPASRPDPKVQYIWDLAADSEGNLLAATGPTGPALEAVAGRQVVAGLRQQGDPPAVRGGRGRRHDLRRQRRRGIDLPGQSRRQGLRALRRPPVRGADAAPGARRLALRGHGGRGGRRRRGRPPALFSQDGDERQRLDRPMRSPSPGRAWSGPAPGAVIPIRSSQPPSTTKPAPPRPPAAGSAAPKPVSPGDNAVYRIDTDGVAREVFRARTLVFALCWSEDRLLVGTGPDGQLYEVRDRGAESTPLAKLDNGQILALLAEPGGGILLGTGDPGTVVRLSSGFVPQGELVSEVHDTKLLSRFGALSWRADLPVGTAIAVQVRSGNVGEPDETWSAWSAEQTDASAARAESPPGRFVQYKVKMSTKNPVHTPELTSVSLSFRSSNLPPEISKLEVPDLSTGDGATRQTRLNVRWDVSDPNDDELSYTVQIKKDGWPSWITLTETPITEKTYRLGHDRLSVGLLPDQAHRQRPPLEQPRRRPGPRPGESVVHRRSRPAPGLRHTTREDGPDRPLRWSDPAGQGGLRPRRGALDAPFPR